MNDRVKSEARPIGAPAGLAPMPSPPQALAQLRRPRARWLIAALLSLLVVAGVALAWWSTRGPTSVGYSTAAVSRGSITRTVTATGTVNPVLTIIVGSYVSGVIQELFCDYNTVVKAGQICAKIDPRPYQTVVDQDKANLAVAKAQLEKDKANLVYWKLNSERNRWLAERESVAQDVADNAKNSYDQAVAQIDFDVATIQQREAELATSTVNLDYTNIVSPVKGVVVSRNVTQGQTVAASFQTPTLFLIATDLADMQVDTNVSESDIGGIKEGNNATFTVDAFPKRVFEGKVTQIRQSPQTVQNVVTYDAVVSVDNRDMALMPGMTAATRIIVAQRDGVVRVPNEALRYSPGGLAAAPAVATAAAPAASKAGGPGEAAQARLWVLREGKAVAVPVTIGLDDDNFTEIVSGDLKPGEQVIVGETRGASGQSALPQPRF